MNDTSNSNGVPIEPVTVHIADIMPPMSFPAILRNPKPTVTLASHAEDVNGRNALSSAKSRHDQEGKRWVRRKENAIFSGNPHIVKASKSDMALDVPSGRTTFPEPLPPYLPRSVSAPSTRLPHTDPISSNSGRFSMSLKGMRRELRSSGLRTQMLVQDVEQELVDWLTGGIILKPDSSVTDEHSSSDMRMIGSTRTISEVSRTPLQLIWSISDDAFARYVVHCCARYHQIVSFSKDTDGRRLTYLLRPNVTRPDFAAKASLDTPPISDLDHLSHASEADSDLDSGVLVIREEEGQSDSGSYVNVSRSSSAQRQSSARTPKPMAPLVETRKELREEDGDADDDASSVDFTTEDLDMGVESLTLGTSPTHPVAAFTRLSLADRRAGMGTSGRAISRAESSPSRSPVRVSMRRRGYTSRAQFSRPKSFYDYLYA